MAKDKVKANRLEKPRVKAAKVKQPKQPKQYKVKFGPKGYKWRARLSEGKSTVAAVMSFDRKDGTQGAKISVLPSGDNSLDLMVHLPNGLIKPVTIRILPDAVTVNHTDSRYVAVVNDRGLVVHNRLSTDKPVEFGANSQTADPGDSTAAPAEKKDNPETRKPRNSKRKPPGKGDPARHVKAYRGIFPELHAQLAAKYGTTQHFTIGDVAELLKSRYVVTGPIASAVSIGMEYMDIISRKRDKDNRRILLKLKRLPEQQETAAETA